MRYFALWTAVFIICAVAFVSQITFFFVPKLTISNDEDAAFMIVRTSKTNFLDSPKGVCKRQVFISDYLYFCEPSAAADILADAHIITRVPFSWFFYRLTYDEK